jgi:hypothetical protein
VKSPFVNLRAEAGRGRPREITLTADQAKRYQQLVLLANKDKRKGSASMAFRVLCQEFPEIGWNPNDRASKHQLPAVAKELAAQVQGLVPKHRQGERGLRHNGAYTPGMLRKSPMGDRRAWGGERASWDDATVNFGVVIPWPYGGCKLSEKYGVKLGRFQLLLCHDEATSFVPAWSHVIRESQGYRGTDVAEAVMRVSRDVCLFESLVLEGGVWQGARMGRVMEAMGVNLISAKGRPQCKLVENFFNRLWTRIGMEPGLSSVGRFRGEEKAVSDFYVKCRAGGADPRGKFPTLTEAVDGMERSIRFLNADRIESAVYGKWVPQERWEMDMAEHPRPVMEPEKLWLASPVMATRTVGRNGIAVKTPGPLGLPMRYQFTGPCLVEHEGKQVDIYFDPLAEWPLHAIVTRPGSTVALGRVECANPYSEGGIGPAAAKMVRDVMRREYRVLWSGGQSLAISGKESGVRGLNGVIEISSGTNLQRSGPGQLAGSGERGIATASDHEPRCNGGAAELMAGSAERGGRGFETPPSTDRTPAPDRLLSLSRKAAKARDQVPNW